MIESILSSNEADKKLLLSKDENDRAAMTVQHRVFHRLSDDQKQFAQTMLRQGEYRPEDSIRSFVVGGGAKSSEVLEILTQLPALEQAKIRDEYSQKYGANMVADLNYWLKSDEEAMLTGLVKTDGRTAAEVYNEELDQYSRSRDGFGQWFVDNEWDVTGFQAEEAVGEYSRALAQSAASGQELEAARQIEITQQIAQSLSNFRNSKSAAGEAVANGTITGVAVVAAPFTAGTSLTLLAKVAIAGAAGAAIKVGAKAAIGGADYDYSAKRLTVDGGTGFISGAVSVLGPAELASVLGVGGKVGTQAASIATSSLAQIGKQSGELLIKEGSEELVTNSFVALVRQAMVSGSEKVPEQALSSLAQQIATKGNEAVVELALKQSLNAAITEATARSLANYSVRVGLPTANGAISGALSGTVTGAAEWDRRLPAGKNVENIAVSAGVNSAVNAATAFTVGTLTYRARSGKDSIPAKTHSGEGPKVTAPSQVPDAPEPKMHSDLRGSAHGPRDPNLLQGIRDAARGSSAIEPGRGSSPDISTLPVNVSTTTRGLIVAQPRDLIVTTGQGKGALTTNAFSDTRSTQLPSAYRKAEVVMIRPFQQPATWRTESGRSFHASEGDILMVNAQGDFSVTTPEIFNSKFEAKPGIPNVYQRTSMISARKLIDNSTLMTPKGPVYATSGDYVVRGRNSENYVVPAKKFESMYTPINSQSVPKRVLFEDSTHYLGYTNSSGQAGGK